MEYRFLTDRHTLCNLEKMEGTTSVKIWLRKDNPHKPKRGDLVVVKSGSKRVMFKVIYGANLTWYPLLDTEDISGQLKWGTIGEYTVHCLKSVKGEPYEVRQWSLYVERHHEHFTHGCVIS